jgi:uncharacterized membrane protein HdeD (DUF308 family)
MNVVHCELQCKEETNLAKGSGTANSIIIGIIAIIAGIVVILGYLSITYIIGAFLIIYGLLTLIRR